jgi:hypothetical protein
MDFLSTIFKITLGALPTAAKKLVPQHIQRRAAARLNDLSPFRTISANHDLVRALRIAWVQAACEVLDAAKHRASKSSDVASFELLARQELVAVRDAAFDRRSHPSEMAIDAHLHAVLQGVPELVVAEPAGLDRAITKSFTETLAAVTRWDAREVPGIFGQIAEAGLPIQGGGPPRSFGDLVFAAFAELIKDPYKYPQAREAFHIAMDKLARDLAEATLGAVRGLDAKVDDAIGRIDALTVLQDGITWYLEALPEIATGVARIDARTERIEAAQQDHSAILAQLLDIAQAKGAFQRAAEQGISEAAVREFVARRILMGEHIAHDDLIPWLDKWIQKAEDIEVNVIPVKNMNWVYFGDNKHVDGGEFSFSIDIRLFITPAPIFLLSCRVWYFTPDGVRCPTTRNVGIHINGNLQSTIADLETFSRPISSTDGSLHIRYGAKLRPLVREQTPADCEFGDLQLRLSLLRLGREVQIERLFRFEPGGILLPIDNIRCPPWLSDSSIAKYHSDGAINNSEYTQVSKISHVERYLIATFDSYRGRLNVSAEVIRILRKLYLLELDLKEPPC